MTKRKAPSKRAKSKALDPVKPTSPPSRRVSAAQSGRRPNGMVKLHEYSKATETEAVALAKRGATIEEIAVILDLRPGQVREHYGAKVNRELALITLRVEEAVIKSASGEFTHPDVHISMYEGDVIKTKLVRHYPPNPAHSAFWLKNRQPAHKEPGAWQDEPAETLPSPDDATALIRARLKQIDEAGG